jgi:hypothetical protein
MLGAALRIALVITSATVLAFQAWAQDYEFSYICDDQGDIIDADSLALFDTYLTNTGSAADTYQLVVEKALPGIWQALACLPDLCFPDSASVFLEPDSTVKISVDIMPLGFSGAGTVTMRVTSQGDTAQTADLPLTAITNTGVDVLIVDDDGGQAYETYYRTALDSAGKSHGTLDHVTTRIDADRMAPFSAVVWFTGEATPVLTEGDRQAISRYLDDGGRLFISGQDIAYALCDSASGESDENSVNWFWNTFIAQYKENNSGALTLNGVDGHPISEGLTISISGGDGADNQISPDVIEPQGHIFHPPWPLFQYAGGISVAAMTLDTQLPLSPSKFFYRLVYFAFGFEAIDNAADRALLMKRIMDYLEGSTQAEGAVVADSRPQDFFLSPNHPNPFNAVTALALSVPGDEPAAVSLRIYNVLGQEVRTLIDGPVMPGSHLMFWDGTDEAGSELASGVYFARMMSGRSSQCLKMVLAR